jgi:DNA-binding CsgD family transcriptional regulator
LVATGHNSASIGARLGIAVPTVRKHRENLIRKLDLHSIAEVTAFALRNGLLAS